MKTLKQLLLTGIAVLLCTFVYAQPQRFNYQAVARNNNVIIANSPVGVLLTITQGNGGTSLYQETQSPTTNVYGIFSLQVGDGTPVSGDFTTIDWKSGDKWLKVEMDPTGGTNYSDMGSSELISVPYALHSKGAWDENGNEIRNPNTGTVVINNSLVVDQASGNTGTVANGLTFGLLSGEGIGSDRSGSTTHYGLDFYTSSTNRMTVANNGKVGIGTNDPQALLHVKGSGDFGLANGSTNCVAFFENVDGANADGIAIKINNTITNRDNNYVTFYNGANEVTGRIDGFDASNGDWVNPPSITIPSTTLNYNFSPGTVPTLTGNYPTLTVDLTGPISLTGGIWPNLQLSTTNLTIPGVGTYDFVTGFSGGMGNPPTGISTTVPRPVSLNGGSWPTWTAGSPPSLSFNTLNPISTSLPDSNDAQNLACWSIENGVADMLNLDPFSMAANHLKGSIILACKDGGVTYGSHGADYAEYIEKADHDSYVQAFDVVGIKGGKVSRNTEGAEQIMIVSSKPVVLGNAPKKGEEKNFAVCGFMGQLPCVVRGLCHKGDYVLASNLNDGTAVAIAPENLTIDMLDRIVGRAWGEQTSEIYGLVNVAIGLKTNEWVSIFKNQEKKMDQLSADVDMLKAAIGIKNVNAWSKTSASINK